MAQSLRRGHRIETRRFANSRGQPAVQLIAFSEISARDLYHRLLTIGWGRFLAGMATAYILFNVAFALLYLAQDGGIGHARPGSFADAFFFSVQTMATIGYGDLYPQTLYANLMVTAEIMLGMTGLAATTGLIFARFSRPTARVMFSRVAVIAPYDGVPTLMFRAANQRRNQILEAQVTVALLRDEQSRERVAMRRFHDLTLARSRTPAFSLTWTVMHPIDERSPLFGATAATLKQQQAEIVVGIIGLDETFAQTIHARHSYLAEEILWDRRFADILNTLDDGTRIIDYRRFHEVEELRPPA